MIVRSIAAALLAGICFLPAPAEVNADSAIIVQFQKRVADYVQLRKGVEAQMPSLKTTASVEKIDHHERELGERVRAARKDAKVGDIFTPDIQMEIRRLIAIAMHPDGKKIAQSLQHAEPIQLRLKVNDRYPHRVPLQSTPPSLLDNLPMLPQDIEYRVNGTDLLLLDIKADLIVDIIPGVFS